MQNELNTKQARKLVAALIKQKNTAIWNSWTNVCKRIWIRILLNATCALEY